MKVNFNKTLAYPNAIDRKIAFRGVSLGDFDGTDRFDYTNIEIDKDEDIAKKFETSLKNIKDACAQKKKQVTGFFKKKKKARIQKEADDKISGFLRAQEISLETQNKIVELLEEKCELLKKNNADKAQLEEAKKHF